MAGGGTTAGIVIADGIARITGIAGIIGIRAVTGILIVATGIIAVGDLPTDQRAGPSRGLFSFGTIGIGADAEHDMARPGP